MGSNLKPEIARKLADLIETIPQAVGALREGECFCIEGALCELYRRETGEGEWVTIDGYSGIRFADGGPEVAFDAAPMRVMIWAQNERFANPWFGGLAIIGADGKWSSALELNDHGHTFAMFAKELRS